VKLTNKLNTSESKNCCKLSTNIKYYYFDLVVAKGVYEWRVPGTVYISYLARVGGTRLTACSMPAGSTAAVTSLRRRPVGLRLIVTDDV